MELITSKENAHSNRITSVGFNNDGTKIVSGSYDQTIKVWGFKTKKGWFGKTKCMPSPTSHVPKAPSDTQHRHHYVQDKQIMPIHHAALTHPRPSKSVGCRCHA
jgi:WD40 repeat protein